MFPWPSDGNNGVDKRLSKPLEAYSAQWLLDRAERRRRRGHVEMDGRNQTDRRVTRRRLGKQRNKSRKPILDDITPFQNVVAVTGMTVSPTTREMKTVQPPTPGATPLSPGTTLHVITVKSGSARCYRKQVYKGKKMGFTQHRHHLYCYVIW